jgi:hypothetical protein
MKVTKRQNNAILCGELKVGMIVVDKYSISLMLFITKEKITWINQTGAILSCKNYGQPFARTAPVITEGGGRIVNERGETIQAWPLDSKTIEDFGRRVRDREIQLDCASYAIKGRLPYVFFIGEGYTLPTKYGGATIFTELDRFLEHGLKSGVCKINFRTRGSEAAAARDSRPSWPGVLWNEASADLTIGDKGTALTWLSTYLDIPLSKTLVAGNDENDTPMFALPDTIKICVGDLLTTVKMQELGIHVRVQDPNALGHTLQNLFR